MEITLSQQIYYSNKELVPLREIADSLIALENVVRQSPEVFEKLFPGTKITGIEVFLNEIRSDSIYEDLVVKFIFGSQGKLDQIIDDVRNKIGLQYLSAHPKIFSVVILSMLFVGSSYYVSKYRADSSAERKIIIEGNNNTVISVGANLLNMDSHELRAVIDTAIKDKDKLSRDAMRVILPAKRDSTASIKFNNDDQLQVTNETVRAIPRHVIEPEPEEFIEEIDNAEIVIRAADLDSCKKGWAVVVPSLSDKRVRLQLDPRIDTEHLMLHPNLKGNITVVFTLDSDKNRLPKLVFLKSLSENEEQQKVSKVRPLMY